MSKKAKLDIKQLRTIGHQLKPVVTIAGKGLTDNVLTEINRALNDHELIKIKLAVGGPEERLAATNELSERTNSQVVQRIGNIVLLLRRYGNPDPKLSNLVRPLT